MLLRTISLTSFKSSFLPKVQKSVGVFRCRTEELCNDDMYWDWLRRSAGEVANYLDLNLLGSPDEIYEARVDGVWRHDMTSWWLKRLPVRPILSVDEIMRYYGEYRVSKVPSHWAIKSNPVAGTIQIVPNPGSTNYDVTPTIYTAYYRGPYMPHEFRVKYKAGFSYLLRGTIAATAGSNVVTVVPEDASESAGTAISGFAYSYLGVRNPVWLFFNNESHQVERTDGTSAYLRTYVSENYTGEAYILAYPDNIRSAVMALAAIYVIEHLASQFSGVSSASLSIDALSQSKAFAVGKGYGIYSPLIERAQENFQRTLADAWDAWGPLHMVAT